MPAAHTQPNFGRRLETRSCLLCWSLAPYRSRLLGYGTMSLWFVIVSLAHKSAYPHSLIRACPSVATRCLCYDSKDESRSVDVGLTKEHGEQAVSEESRVSNNTLSIQCKPEMSSPSAIKPGQKPNRLP